VVRLIRRKHLRDDCFNDKSKNTDYLELTGFGLSVPAGALVTLHRRGSMVEVENVGTVPAGAQTEKEKENSFMINGWARA